MLVLGIILGTLVANLFRNMSAGKPKTPSRGGNRAGREVIRAGQDFRCCLIS